MANEIGSMAQRAVADVSNEDAIESVMEDVARQHGRIDVLFNNAGINRRNTSFDLTIADWNAVVTVKHDRHVSLRQEPPRAHARWRWRANRQHRIDAWYFRRLVSEYCLPGY
ncbi:SDR family NAD(P)-dependent oxidoreductase [Cupriavidus basilensis]